MALSVGFLQVLTKNPPKEAWSAIVQRVLAICTEPLVPGNAASEVTRRDREIGALDLFLSSAGWDLWSRFEETVDRTSDRLSAWWSEPHSAKAVLVLDSLSLRELPWLLQGASERGMKIGIVAATASELPSDTTQFAQALGFGQRSSLSNNGAGPTKWAPLRTECNNLPWLDCTADIDTNPHWLYWHHWPDNKVHELAAAGHGLDMLVKETADRLTSDDFWTLIDRLSNGRRLVITSDHGYAATGLFIDSPEDQAIFLKDAFKSGRAVEGKEGAGPWVPPVALALTSRHGEYLYALGRRKWKSQGGYPTLSHGGLSLLEVLCPFVEIYK